jgi:hypothetical protein
MQGWRQRILRDFLQSFARTPHSSRVRHMSEQKLTVREVAEMLKIDEKTDYWLASELRVPGLKVSGSWVFHTGDIEHWNPAQVKRSASGKGGEFDE